MNVVQLPDTITHTIFLLVSISVNILTIESLEELSHHWVVHASFSLVWTDQRLKMQNLKNNTKRNLLSLKDRSKIWLPDIIFLNNPDRNLLVFDQKAEVFVKRTQENPSAARYQDINNALIYKGIHNTLHYSRFFTEKFTCNFNLQYYPFDIQTCGIHLTVPTAVTDLVELVPAGINYTGPYQLNQFEVLNFSATSFTTSASFKIKLRRLYSYQMISLYIPSASLLFASLLTNYVSGSHYEVNIMVHITIMLVMYTLFQASSASLPQVRVEPKM